MLIKRGTILTLTMGDWADFDFDGPFLVLREFDNADLVEQFANASERPRPVSFIVWLQEAGYVGAVPAALQWHLGSLDRFKPDIGLLDGEG